VARRLIECVPNFSEGRDREKVAALVDAVRSVSGVIFLGLELDPDHNRSVLTFAGPPENVAEAALRVVGKAVEVIDLTQHAGAHPRVGAADVVPFVPIEGVTLEECARIAHQVGHEIWRRYQVPVYFYEAAARRPDRVHLENLRRGQFETLREEVLTDSVRAPDVGEPRLHPTAGAVVVGARKYLIAFNINLNTPDVEVAKKIARAIRYSSGGFRYVKAIGVPLGSRRLAQVSINLTDFEQTPLHRIFETVRLEAARYGADIAGSEIVGLIPRRALEAAGEYFLRCENFTPDSVLEDRLAREVPQVDLTELLESLAAPPERPVAATAAAVAAAVAAALAVSVATQVGEPASEFEAAQGFFAEAVQRHRAAVQAVAGARSASGAEAQPALDEALQQAALLTLEVAERAHRLLLRVEDLDPDVAIPLSADLATARALARGARASALAGVGSQLETLTDGALLERILKRLGAIESD